MAAFSPMDTDIILASNQINKNTFFIPRYFWPLFFFATLLSYFVATESGTELVINIDQEWAEFFLYLAVGLNLLRTYILLGNAQPSQNQCTNPLGLDRDP